MALEWKESSYSAKGRGCCSASADTSNSNSDIVRFTRMKSTNEKGRAVMSSDEEIGTEKSGDLPNGAGSSDGASMEKSKSDSLRFGRNHSSQNSKRVVCSEDEEVGNVVRNSEKRDGDGNREREGGELGTEIEEAIMELEEAASKIRWLKDLLCFGLSPPASKWKFLPNRDQ